MLPDKSSAETMKGIVTLLDGLKIHSITYDNGLESAMHESINELLESESFFCKPYHSWEKGRGRIQTVSEYLGEESFCFSAIGADALHASKVTGWRGAILTAETIDLIENRDDPAKAPARWCDIIFTFATEHHEQGVKDKETERKTP